MKIITYNVNGIRAALRKGLDEWVAENDFDIICLQESKAQPEQVDLSAFHKLGYRNYWYSAEKKRIQWCGNFKPHRTAKDFPRH